MRKTPPLSGSQNAKKHSKLGLWENHVHRKQLSAEFAQTLPYTQKRLKNLEYFSAVLSLSISLNWSFPLFLFLHEYQQILAKKKKMAKRKQKPHVFIINRNICLSTLILCIQNVLIYLRPSFHPKKNVCKYLIIMCVCVCVCVGKIIRSLF